MSSVESCPSPKCTLPLYLSVLTVEKGGGSDSQYQTVYVPSKAIASAGRVRKFDTRLHGQGVVQMSLALSERGWTEALQEKGKGFLR